MVFTNQVSCSRPLLSAPLSPPEHRYTHPLNITTTNTITTASPPWHVDQSVLGPGGLRTRAVFWRPAAHHTSSPFHGVSLTTPPLLPWRGNNKCELIVVCIFIVDNESFLTVSLFRPQLLRFRRQQRPRPSGCSPAPTFPSTLCPLCELILS